MKLFNAALGREYSNHANEIQLKLVDYGRNRIPQKQISKVLDLNLTVKEDSQGTVGKNFKRRFKNDKWGKNRKNLKSKQEKALSSILRFCESLY